MYLFWIEFICLFFCSIMHEKDFDQWSNEKKNIHYKKDNKNFYPKIREVFYAKIGVNIGFESDGKSEFMRPVLILSKIGSLYWAVPLTSKYKQNFFHHELQSISFSNIEHSLIMLSQSRIIDKRRLVESLGMVSKEEFQCIQKKMKSMYFPSL